MSRKDGVRSVDSGRGWICNKEGLWVLLYTGRLPHGRVKWKENPDGMIAEPSSRLSDCRVEVIFRIMSSIHNVTANGFGCHYWVGGNSCY